ncbi:MAG TPA: SGNH/GDSL hydrolase family protein [Terriglobia bacterium]|nr:SGNH/GDSL hydrolase family protein [Terriglobia bacterium]
MELRFGTRRVGAGEGDDFVRNFVIMLALILGLLSLNLLPRIAGRGQNRLRIQKVVGEMKNGDLNREDFDALTAGYYEGLQKNAGHLGLPVERDDVRFSDDFLLYEFRPNVSRRYPAGMRITNSLGMPNAEYGYLKPPHTRRIALFGDSLSVGPFGHDYVALLEERLNQANLTPEIQRYEILNFSVYGYNVLQMMDLALYVAPKFHPDVYLVTLTHIQAGGKKASTALHLSRLVLEGIDLKYDFLKQVATQASIQPSDHMNALMRKLSPFHFQMTRWALEKIRDQATAEGAQMIIVLVPGPIPPDVEAQAFDDILPTVDSIGVPVIDLRDTFRGKNLANLQVEYGVDVHPNQQGHEIIFESLYRAIQQDPKSSAALLGQ